MLYLSAPRLLPVIVFLLLPFFLNPYWQKVMISVAVFAILAISWDMLSQSGMISLAENGVLTRGLTEEGLQQRLIEAFSPAVQARRGLSDLLRWGEEV